MAAAGIFPASVPHVLEVIKCRVCVRVPVAGNTPAVGHLRMNRSAQCSHTASLHRTNESCSQALGLSVGLEGIIRPSLVTRAPSKGRWVGVIVQSSLRQIVGVKMVGFK